MNELQDFRLDDLYEKMQLEDEQFQDWLVSIGLLNGRKPCTCGNDMKKKILPNLIIEFNWRERFGRRNVAFFNFWSQVAVMYPCI
uniref:Uncharacterized protein n=1 Tax=Acrobeloides nanus TaxID=290746 RepID=A0A914ECB8_9BILA